MLRTGVDLGTAYLTVVVTNGEGVPLAGEYQYAEVARDGLVVDFIGAVERLRACKARLERRIGRPLEQAHTGYPPGVGQAEVRTTAHVLEAAGFHCSGLTDEPTAANEVLRLRDGAVVDVGGGTTGIAVVQDGEVVYTADEATGGTHFSLVIAGALDLEFEGAERIKTDPVRQGELLPTVRPVMEKVASIIARHVKGFAVPAITLVGGSSGFVGMAEVVEEYTGIPTMVPPHPAFVTPLGLALRDA
jgi:ethanolamine utilization protein EutJ